MRRRKSRTWPSSRRSVRWKVASPPIKRIWSWLASPSSFRRPQKNTLAPRFAKAIAVACPIPVVAPVISTAVSAKSPFGSGRSGSGPASKAATAPPPRPSPANPAPPTAQSLRRVFKDFVTWANKEAVTHDRVNEIIPDDPNGSMALVAFAGAWHGTSRDVPTALWPSRFNTGIFALPFRETTPHAHVAASTNSSILRPHARSLTPSQNYTPTSKPAAVFPAPRQSAPSKLLPLLPASRAPSSPRPPLAGCWPTKTPCSTTTHTACCSVTTRTVPACLDAD